MINQEDNKREDNKRAELGKEVWNDWANGELNKHEDKRAGVDFSGAILPKMDFSGFIFPGRADFTNVTFNGEALFEGAKFKGDARFEGAMFKGFADFEGATFEGKARFEGATFESVANFTGATFGNWTYFERSTFGSLAYFTCATFKSMTNFNNATFENVTSFIYATFKSAPGFHNAAIHQDTAFSFGEDFFKQFPDTKSEHSERAYRTLKMAMNKHQAHTEEAGFFKLELKARAKKEARYRAWMYGAYGLLSNYGQSVSKPLIWWAGLGVAMFFLYFSISGEPGKAFTVAMGQALPLIGAEKNAYYAALKVIFPPCGHASFWFQIIRVFHMIVSSALIFLSLLALRNRFKIK